MKAAWTGVHGGDEDKICGEGNFFFCPRDGDLVVFKGLTK